VVARGGVGWHGQGSFVLVWGLLLSTGSVYFLFLVDLRSRLLGSLGAVAQGVVVRYR
jgi:hypothetical protein